MKLVGNIYCNWCADLITEDEKYARVRRGNKLFHYHNRHINDCYVLMALEEENEKKAKAKAPSQQELPPSPTKKSGGKK